MREVCEPKLEGEGGVNVFPCWISHFPNPAAAVGSSSQVQVLSVSKEASVLSAGAALAGNRGSGCPVWPWGSVPHRRSLVISFPKLPKLCL